MRWETFSLTRRHQLRRIYLQRLDDTRHQRQMRLPATHIVLLNWTPKVSLLGPTYLNHFVLLHRSWLKSVKTNVWALLISCSFLTVLLGLSITWFTGDDSSLFGLTSLNLVISCAACPLMSYLCSFSFFWNLISLNNVIKKLPADALPDSTWLEAICLPLGLLLISLFVKWLRPTW